MVYPTLSFSYLAITTSLFPFQSVKRNTFFLRFIHRKGFNKGMKGDYSFSILFWKVHVIPLIINHCVLRWVLSDNLICFLSLYFFKKKLPKHGVCVFIHTQNRYKLILHYLAFSDKWLCFLPILISRFIVLFRQCTRMKK